MSNRQNTNTNSNSSYDSTITPTSTQSFNEATVQSLDSLVDGGLPRDSFPIDFNNSPQDIMKWTYFDNVSVPIPEMPGDIIMAPTRALDQQIISDLKPHTTIPPEPVKVTATPSSNLQDRQESPPPVQSSHRVSKRRSKPNSPSNLANTVRKRTLTACESCRIKKIKCDLNKPTCTNCIKFSMKCIYRQTNIEPIIQPTPIPISDNELDERDLDMGDLTNSTNFASANDKTKISHSVRSCNWLANFEDLVTWDVYSQFKHTHNLKSINTKLVFFSKFDGYEKTFKLLTDNDLDSINIDLHENLETYISNYIMYVQDKNPFIDLNKLRSTTKYIMANKEHNVFELDYHPELIPLLNLLLICCCSLLSKPFDFKSQDIKQTSKQQKSANFIKSLRYFQLANQLQASFSHRIPDFDLNIIQFYLLSSTFYMLNMKPIQTWDLIHRSSIRIITILESFKNSDQKFTQKDFRIIERYFFTCFKYESELRVELSPLVPSSGIIDYPFPSLYPTIPPIRGSSIEEQTSWFYYLTELSLRKLENRILDFFYCIESSSANESRDGEFVSDNYTLNWDDKWTLASAIAKAAEFLGDVKKIENQMLLFLKPALSRLDQDSLTEILKPKGFVLKDFLNEAELKKLQKRKKQNSKQSPRNSTCQSDASSGNSPKGSMSEVPEVLNYIKTRMLVLKVLLFRPILYHVYKMTRDEILSAISNNTFLKNLIQQGVESWDHLDMSLAKHRHFGSWFYLRNMVSIGTLFYGLFIKLREALMEGEKLKSFYLSTVEILKYWVEECPEFTESILLFEEFLRDIDNSAEKE